MINKAKNTPKTTKTTKTIKTTTTAHEKTEHLMCLIGLLVSFFVLSQIFTKTKPH